MPMPPAMKTLAAASSTSGKWLIGWETSIRSPTRASLAQILRSAAALRVALDAQEIAACVGRIADQRIAAHETAIELQVHVRARRKGGKSAAIGIAQIQQAHRAGLERDRVQTQADALLAHVPFPRRSTMSWNMAYRRPCVSSSVPGLDAGVALRSMLGAC